MMKRLFSLLLCVLVLPALAADISPAVQDGRIWQWDRNGFAANFAQAFFTMVDETRLRFPPQSAIEIGRLNVGDLIISFEGESGRINLLQATVYNKGDDGELEKKEFETKLSNAVARLDAITGTSGKPHKVLRRESGVNVSARIWETENAVWLLEAAGSGSRKNYSAEFIRLTVGPDSEALERGGAHDAAHRSELRGKVKTEESGDVWIEGIPMVDQGEKGYCVPATVSRVFAYYGMDGVDQHALAALCKSSGDGGTSMMMMEEALQDISSKFHIKVIELDKGGISEFISSYNAAAKKMKKPGLNARRRVRLDPAILMEARAGKPAQTRKWMKSIKKSIDAGLPVLWSVQLVFPEEGLMQLGGGHMRLIIGYNEQTEAIIYSDSWGARHVRKEMPLEQACAMTVCRYVLRPTR